jgi:hypothetical protein
MRSLDCHRSWPDASDADLRTAELASDDELPVRDFDGVRRQSAAVCLAPDFET